MPLREPLSAFGAELLVMVVDEMLTEFVPACMRIPPPPSFAPAPFAVFPLMVLLFIVPRLRNIPPEAAPAVLPLMVEFSIVAEALAEIFAPPPLPEELFPLMEERLMSRLVPAKLIPPLVLAVEVFAVIVELRIRSVFVLLIPPPKDVERF